MSELDEKAEWVMVPRTPTVAMLRAAADCRARIKSAHNDEAIGSDYYHAMLAASPAPTVSGEDEHELFNNWWAMDQAGGGFPLTVKNVAFAAWNARSVLSPAPTVNGEAVAWMHPNGMTVTTDPIVVSSAYSSPGWTPLYTHPAPIERMTKELDRWEETAAASERRVAHWQSRTEAAESELAKAREALKPFAAIMDIFEMNAGNRPKSGTIYSWEDHRVGERELTVEMLQEARAALKAAP
jgi:hypothetical protein